MSMEENGGKNIEEASDETLEKLETKNVSFSTDGNKLETTNEAGETEGATHSSTEKVADVAERANQIMTNNEDEEKEEIASQQQEKESDAERGSSNLRESKETENVGSRDPGSSTQYDHASNLDDIESDITRKTDVIIEKSEISQDDAIEEDRSQYIWEGSCSSSSSSEDETKPKKEKTVTEGDISEVELKTKVFPRDEYIKMYGSLIRERVMLRKKNVVLQKHVYEYCKKRKLEVYYDDISTPDPKLEAKYTRQLITFQEFMQLDKERRISLQEDLENLRKEHVDAEVTFDQVLGELIETEREVGTGLISAMNGKTLQDRALEKVLNKQRKTILELHDIRLKYIQLRDSLAMKEAALKKLETFGEGLHILDYEQLRFENQSYSDKIDERDEELTHLRTNATSSIQILAHIREKADSTALNIEELYDDLEYMEIEANKVREHSVNLKKQTDELREQLSKLRRNAGLLVHQHLIKDFERRIEESQALAVEIENLKNNYYDQNKQLKKVQETIKAHKSLTESLHSQIMNKSSSLFSRTHSRKSSVSQDSNQLQDASLEEESVSQLKEIKKGRPSFFPQEKYAKLAYVRKNNRIE